MNTWEKLYKHPIFILMAIFLKATPMKQMNPVTAKFKMIEKTVAIIQIPWVLGYK